MGKANSNIFRAPDPHYHPEEWPETMVEYLKMALSRSPEDVPASLQINCESASTDRSATKEYLAFEVENTIVNEESKPKETAPATDVFVPPVLVVKSYRENTSEVQNVGTDDSGYEKSDGIVLEDVGYGGYPRMLSQRQRLMIHRSRTERLWVVDRESGYVKDPSAAQGGRELAWEFFLRSIFHSRLCSSLRPAMVSRKKREYRTTRTTRVYCRKRRPHSVRKEETLWIEKVMLVTICGIS
ncbi:hypothetical protein BJ742DRAFT_775933 [Cladochytrium replicatum]|nr:hypothetical protein BJ742DRAFT_775933 [Cladochytrium replicatum]